jgi:hypothetical protein
MLISSDRRGNRVLIGINCLNFVLYLFAKGYYVWRNKQRNAIWDKMTSDVSIPTEAPEFVILVDMALTEIQT